MSIFDPRFRLVVVDLRHVGVDAQRVESLHVKELLCRSCIDQLPDVDRRAVTTPSNGA